MTQPAARNGPRSAVEQSEHHGQGLLLILVAAFMVVLDFSIVNVALPSIQSEFGFSSSTVQWVVTGYAITFGGVLILGGRAADLFGRRRIFMTGLVVFTAASLAGGLADDPLLLVTSRVVQGIGAALVAPAALSLITTGFAEGPARTRALGMYGATASIGFVSGQVLGGVLVEFFSWRSVFLVNVPVGVLALLLAPRLLRESRHAPGVGRPHLDAGGALLVTIAVAAVVFAVSQANVLSWWSVAAALLLAVSATVVFAFVERHQRDPLIPARLPRLPRLRAGTALTLLLGLWNGGDLLPTSAARLAPDDGPGHGPPGRDRVHRGCVRRAACVPYRDAAVADADQRRGHARLPDTDGPARQRQLQPSTCGGDAHRLRYRRYRIRSNGDRQQRDAERRPRPGRRTDQH